MSIIKYGVPRITRRATGRGCSPTAGLLERLPGQEKRDGAEAEHEEHVTAAVLHEQDLQAAQDGKGPDEAQYERDDVPVHGFLTLLSGIIPRPVRLPESDRPPNVQITGG